MRLVTCPLSLVSCVLVTLMIMCGGFWCDRRLGLRFLEKPADITGRVHRLAAAVEAARFAGAVRKDRLAAFLARGERHLSQSKMRRAAAFVRTGTSMPRKSHKIGCGMLVIGDGIGSGRSVSRIKKRVKGLSGM